MAAAAATLVLVTPAVAAFGTINFGGQNAEHERITRTALECPPQTYLADGACFEPLSITSLAGGDGSFGAIGAPDSSTEALEPRAHCDDADYLDHAKWGLPGTYPHSKETRNKALVDCYEYLRDMWDRGVRSAAAMVDERGGLVKDQVRLAVGGGTNVQCMYTGGLPGRAKCNVYDGLGRALHGLQDFYAHSNWVDDASIQPAANVPPGLGNTGLAPFLTMANGSGPSADTIPDDLTTGCFNVFGHDTVEGAAACEQEGRRITHAVVNKDKGTIKPQPLADVTAAALTSDPTTPRGNYSDNFERAVRAAVLETRRQWAEFRAAVISKHGADDGRLIICALTRDYPVRDCVPGRNIALVLDGPAVAPTAKEIVANLVTATQPGEQPADKVSVFDARGTVSAPADPANVSLAVAHSGLLADSVRLATAGFNGTAKEGIVILATAFSGNVSDTIAAIDSAAQRGVRVSYAFIPFRRGVARRALRFLLRRADDTSRWIHNDIAAAVLRTGGSYVVVNNERARGDFAKHILEWGVTNTDSRQLYLYPDLTTVDNADMHYTHLLNRGGRLNVTVTALTGSALTVALTADGKASAKGAGTFVGLTLQADNYKSPTVDVFVQSTGLYSITLGSTSPSFRVATVVVLSVLLGLLACLAV